MAHDDEALKREGETAGAAFERLMAILARLRAPGGCPWDAEQSFESIAPYTIEEAYEVADAIERADMVDLEEEIGDLALQVVYHCAIAAERGAFDARDALNTSCAKMLRRHPHVFDGAERFDWEAIKTAEKIEKRKRKAEAAGHAAPPPASALDDVPCALPALTRALKLQAKAARVGFDWPAIDQVLAKVVEEAEELAEARAAADQAALAEEFGDLLFVMVNLGRHLKLDPESALRDANAKFTRRFHAIEAALGAEGRRPEDATLEEMDAHWEAAKRAER